ncbi:MAG: hypothetical protein JXA89_03275 [Anaerolineae bacterium]|nr:hypothetical protein [Anaerolineae bacterium]
MIGQPIGEMLIDLGEAERAGDLLRAKRSETTRGFGTRSKSMCAIILWPSSVTPSALIASKRFIPNMILRMIWTMSRDP